MSTSGNRIVEVARSQLGKTDETRYGADQGEAWCSEFVSWVYYTAGYPFTSGPSGRRWHLASVRRIKTWFNNYSTFVSKGHPDWYKFTPTPGDYVCFGNSNDPESHSGIVEKLTSSGTLYTIEGNSGDMVRRKIYPNFRNNTNFNKWVQGMGLRCGKRIRIANGRASASSSGNNRHPRRAFDMRNDTFWRNRTHRGRNQYLQMIWTRPQTITKVSLTYGNHYPRDYRFYVFNGVFWQWSKTIHYNQKLSRAHVWFRPKKNVRGLRIMCTRYSRDDYFSIREMKIQR